MRIVASKKGDGTIEKELFSPESLKQNGVALTNGYASLPPPPSFSLDLTPFLSSLSLFTFYFRSTTLTLFLIAQLHRLRTLLDVGSR